MSYDVNMPGVALWEASFVLAEWLSRQGDAKGLGACGAYQERWWGEGVEG